MDLGRKVLLPTSLAYDMLVGVTKLVLEEDAMKWGTRYALLITALSGVATFAFKFMLYRGRTITGAAAQRAQKVETLSISRTAPAGD
jgi:hypothetical protein